MPFDPYSLGKLTMRAEKFEFSRHFLMNLKEHIAIKETAGAPLIAAAILGLIWSNLLFPGTYGAVWDTDLLLDMEILKVGGQLKFIVNDLLLPLFFFVLGLEIKHELVVGLLSTWRRAAMPLAVAAGGMLAPAAIYLALNAGGAARLGWGIPVATDVAFALAVLAAFGDRIPHNLKVLTMAFAVADDIGGALVIALFYAESISAGALIFAAAVYAVLIFAVRFRIFGGYFIYAVLGTVFILAMHGSGIHATIGGLLLGLAVPLSPVFPRRVFCEKITGLAEHFHEARDRCEIVLSTPESGSASRPRADEYTDGEQEMLGKIDELVRGSESPCSRLRRTFTPLVNYLVLPVFALANTGVAISGESLAHVFESRPALGIVLGLVLGKPAGVLSAAWLAQKLGLGGFPEDVGWKHLAGMAVLAGAGFTVSMFIADLAFQGSAVLPEAKIGVMTASLMAVVISGLYFLLAFRRSP